MNVDRHRVCDIVIAAAEKELMPRFTQIAHDFKHDGSMITEADLACQQRIKSELTNAWPSINFLGEEMTADAQQQILSSSEHGLWVLDPLDGTRNYAAGIPYFAISLALIVNNEIKLAVVYDPCRQECFTAQQGQNAYLNDQPLITSSSVDDLKQATAIIDLKRLSRPLLERVVFEAPYSSQRNYGASALDWCWIAAGRGHVYLHGGQNLWDYAAGQLILQQAGGVSATLDNEPVYQAVMKPRSVVAAVTPSLFQAWSAFLQHS